MTNDSKYVRLYPERAVAPIREVVKRLLAGADRRWGEIEEALKDLDRLSFPPDEPLFLLRGQDELASCAVRHYAEDVRLSKIKEPMRSEMRTHLLDHAEIMERWQPRKLPD